MRLELQHGDTVRQVEIVFCPNWPHLSVPVSLYIVCTRLAVNDVLQVSNCVHLVDCLARLSAPDLPTIVMDTFGATEAAIFCVLSSLVRMMDTEVTHSRYDQLRLGFKLMEDDVQM